MNTALQPGSRQPETFALSNENGLNWARKNRRPLILLAVAAVVVLLLLAGAYAVYQHRTAAAQTALGEAMQTYQTPLVRPGQALPPGMKAFASARERATKANGQFVAVADQYGSTQPGRLAQYFTGLTYMEAGQNAKAEETLKKTASGWNGDISALGKDALAQLYAQTNRPAEAVSLLEELGKGNATTVPPSMAKIQLAELYASEGKTEQSRQIYAEIKDHDKDAKGKPGIAAQVATRKLNPEAEPAGAAGPRGR